MSHLRKVDIRGYRTTDQTFQPIHMDPSSGSIVVIEFAHNRLHAGKAFSYYDIVTLGNGASQDYIITTPNTTEWAHFGFEVTFNDGSGSSFLYEGTDRNGTTLQTTVFNRQRNSVTTNTTTVHKGQSGGTTDGTLLPTKRVGSGFSQGGVAGTLEEIVLKQNTKYLLRLTNNTATNNIYSLELLWYEHTSLV